MSARVFVDTHVFVYLFDRNAPAKQRRARDILERDAPRVFDQHRCTKLWYIVGMRLARDKVRSLARARGLTLSEALRRAKVSRNAFYHLTRQPTVVPRSVHALGVALAVPSSALLDETPPSLDDRAAALLREARRIHARYPQSSFDNIWHTLWLLEVSPAERLQRSLIRGHAASPDR